MKSFFTFLPPPTARRLLALFSLALIPILLAALAGCATLAPPAQPGVKRLARHNWWNYYQRGCEYFNEGNIEAARDDFERALGILPGARFGFPQEMWRARTYGLHFVEGYFPHRELGVCLFLLNKPEAAAVLLEKSMEQLPSGRAKHYLNLARGHQLKQAQLAPPEIRIDGWKDVNVVKDRTVQIAGRARSQGLVRDLKINGTPEFVELAALETPFSRAVPLREGSNRISVVAQDLAGRSATRDVVVFADWQPPSLVIRKAEKAAGGWKLDLVCSDNSSIASLTVDGQERVTDALRATSPRALSVECISDGKTPLTVVADDITGNRIRSAFGPKEIERLAPPADAPTAPRAPSLELQSVAATEVVLREEFYLDGLVTDSDGVAAVTLNGQPLLAENQKGAVQVRFARRVPLAMGTNTLTIATSSLAGKTAERKLQLVRRNPDYLDSDYRLRFEIPAPFRCEPADLKVALKKQLEFEMTRDPVRFHVMERDEQGLALILQELELSSSDMADKKAALQIGKILPVELVLFCSLLKNGKGLTLFSRVVDTTTGEIVWTGDVYAESEKDLVDTQIGGLVMKTEQQFPLIEGHVTAVSGHTLTIDAGTVKGARRGTKLLIVQQPEKTDPGSRGFVVKLDGKPLELEITRTKEDSGVGRIVSAPATGKVKIKEGDYVYAR